jgi:hypothetical protein
MAMYRILLSITALLAFLLLLGGCGNSPKLDVKSIGVRDAKDSRFWIVVRGELNGELAFAVLQGGPRTEEGFESSVSMTHNENNDGQTIAYVNRPDGSRLKLPGEVNLVEIIDGRYSECRVTVSLDDFDSFLDSNPDAFTIHNLITFATVRRSQKQSSQ